MGLITEWIRFIFKKREGATFYIRFKDPTYSIYKELCVRKKGKGQKEIMTPLARADVVSHV